MGRVPLGRRRQTPPSVSPKLSTLFQQSLHCKDSTDYGTLLGNSCLLCSGFVRSSIVTIPSHFMLQVHGSLTGLCI